MNNKFIKPKGTKDFSKEEIIKRNYLIEIIKNNFELFGFNPIETPAFEMLSTLNEKYGENCDKLIFKIIKSGDFIKKINLKKKLNKNYIENIEYNSIVSLISDKALRYDLTIPLVRYINMNIDKIFFPFKRYQIQPVWRADRPQMGRFREFYQCDADIIETSKSLIQEIELIILYDKIFYELKIPITIKFNHRLIIHELLKKYYIKESFLNKFIKIIDNYNSKNKDKKIINELSKYNLDSSLINDVYLFLNMEGNFNKKIEKLKFFFKNSNNINNIINEFIFIYNNCKKLLHKENNLDLDYSLVRGLDYYTGIIFEVFTKKINVLSNSIGGGGRYENLINKFDNKKKLVGIGLSFGLDRIYLIMNKLNLFPILNINYTKVLFLNLGVKDFFIIYKNIHFLREKKISCEFYPKPVKLKKQFKYANKKGNLFVVIIGEKEIQKNKIKIKNLKNKEEKEYNNIIEFFEKEKYLLINTN